MIASSPMPTPTSTSPNELAVLPPTLVRTASTLAPPSMRAPTPVPTTADVPEPPMTRTFDDRATAAAPEAEAAEPAAPVAEPAAPEAEPEGPTPEATQDEEEAKETPNAKAAPSEAPEARRATLTVSIEAANGGRTGKNLAAAFAAADEAADEQSDKKRGREEEETQETPHSPSKAARAEPDA